jgi:ribosome-associated translation inhibitor RaiA
MTIEFHTTFGKVSEKIINDIRNEIIDLSHFSKNINRAEVLLKEDKNIVPAENKICEIRLTVFGNNLFAHARTKNFKDASKEALKDLKRMVKQQVKKMKEPPDQVISSVKV